MGWMCSVSSVMDDRKDSIIDNAPISPLSSAMGCCGGSGCSFRRCFLGTMLKCPRLPAGVGKCRHDGAVRKQVGGRAVGRTQWPKAALGQQSGRRLL